MMRKQPDHSGAIYYAVNYYAGKLTEHLAVDMWAFHSKDYSEYHIEEARRAFESIADALGYTVIRKPTLKTSRNPDDFDEAGPYGENNGPVDADLDLVAARICLNVREDRTLTEVDAAARLLMERGTPGDKARAGVWINARKTEAER